ncbi:MAG: hypothetical protein QOE29_2291 [Gaiellaceae bacterium]|jgi:hypothetical protein|nr:hypothetical protein [Gaiellaceae bacterium]
MDKRTTPWGRATLLEEVVVEHDALERRYDAVVQLLELTDGEQLVRFGSRPHGAHRLGCLTLRAGDLHELEEGLLETERLASILRLVFG